MRLYGKNQVSERLKANPSSIKKIYFLKGSEALSLQALVQSRKVSFDILDERGFSSMAQQHNAQGVIAEIDEFVYSNLDDLLSLPNEKKYTLIALSNITDPQNVGSILRSAACFGGFALIIPKHRNVRVNDTVLKVACGGENYVPVVQVTNLIPALEQAKQAGYWIAGSVVDNGEDITGFKFTFPLCVVIGSEDKGIREGMLRHLDFKVTLPMPGKELSLNAAVAAAIICYETVRQRRQSLPKN